MLFSHGKALIRCIWILPVQACLALLMVGAVCGNAVTIKGTEYTDLKDISARLGMKFRWIQKDHTAELSSEWTRMRFEIHQREMLLNKDRVHLGFPIAEYRGMLMISESDYVHHIQPVLTPQVFSPPSPVRHIIIDAGHGGSDPGAENSTLRLREKSLALDLARRLKKKLAANGFAVSMTRTNDTFIELQDRPRIANQSGADLFISLHFNALSKRDVAGVETYAFTPPFQPSSSRKDLHESDRRTYPGNKNDPWNTLLGFYVQKSLLDHLPSKDRGLKRARFAVLRDLEMPGILVEGGFVSNPTEGRNIGSAAYRERIADAIVEGVLLYQKTTSRLQKPVP